MSDRRTAFRGDVARIKKDANAASGDLVRRLKKLTPEELLRQSPWIFDRLTLDQYRDIVAAIAPQVDLPAADAEEAADAKMQRHSLTTWWRERSVLAKSMIATIIVSAVFSVTGIVVPFAYKWRLSRMEVVRQTTPADWPMCRRLSPTTDGCVYRAAQNLNWDGVAQKLDLPAEILRRNNRHLPPEWIPANTQLVIWRERGRLED